MNLLGSLNTLRANRDLNKDELSIPSQPVPLTYAHGQKVRLALGPGDKPMLLLPVSSSELSEHPPEADGLEIEFAQYKGNMSGSCYFLQVACATSNLENVFLNLVENVCARIRDGKSCLNGLQSTINEFRDLLRIARAPIDRSRIKGLFGELLFLKSVASTGVEPASFWTGPTGGRRDFLFPSTAIEIKTSEHSSNRDVIIHSLGQLDTDDAGSLFLVYYRIEEDPGSGFTVSDLVYEIAKGLGNTSQFREKLKAVGYEQGTESRWDTLKWTVIESQPFQVHDGFPRIITASFTAGVPAGVSSINYTLDLHQAKPFEVPMETLFKFLKNAAI